MPSFLIPSISSKPLSPVRVIGPLPNDFSYEDLMLFSYKTSEEELKEFENALIECDAQFLTDGTDYYAKTSSGIRGINLDGLQVKPIIVFGSEIGYFTVCGGTNCVSITKHGFHKSGVEIDVVERLIQMLFVEGVNIDTPEFHRAIKRTIHSFRTRPIYSAKPI